MAGYAGAGFLLALLAASFCSAGFLPVPAALFLLFAAVTAVYRKKRLGGRIPAVPVPGGTAENGPRAARRFVRTGTGEKPLTDIDVSAENETSAQKAHNAGKTDESEPPAYIRPRTGKAKKTKKAAETGKTEEGIRPRAAACLRSPLFFYRLTAVFCGLAVGFLLYFAAQRLYYQPVLTLAESSHSFRGIVTDCETTEEGCRMAMRVRETDGRRSFFSLLLTSWPSKQGEIVCWPSVGDEVMFSAVPREFTAARRFDSAAYYRSKGVFLRASASVGKLNVTEPSAAPLTAALGAVRTHVRRTIAELVPGDAGAFCRGVLLGDTDDMPDSLRYSLAGAGLSHVVAVSGMHVSLLAAMLWRICGWLRMKPRPRGLLIVPCAIAFAAVAGFTPSAVRAAVMLSLFYVGRLLRRDTTSVGSLQIAASLICLMNPFAIRDTGLLLSYSASLGLLTLGPKLCRALLRSLHPHGWWGRPVTGAVNIVCASVSATLYTLPVTLLVFDDLPLLGVLWNLLAIPLVTVLFISAALLCVFSFWLPAAAVFALPARLASGWVLLVLRLSDAVPARIPTDTALLLLPAAAGALLVLGMRKHLRRKSVAAVLTALTVLAGVGALPADRARRAEETLVTVLDVGQGCCAVASQGRELRYMADCGGENAGRAAELYLRRHGLREIPVLVLSHFDDDHINGVEYISGRFPVRRVFVPETGGDAAAEALCSLLRERGAEVAEVTRTRAVLTEDAELWLYPLSDRRLSDNGTELVLRAVCGGSSALYPGDLPAELEDELLRETDRIAGTKLLVVPHHGSADGCSPVLLAAMRPEIAVIPVGQNSYGHPAQETIYRLRRECDIIVSTRDRGSVSLRFAADGTWTAAYG